MTLKKATLQEIDTKPTAVPQPIKDSPVIPVQVNPTSLHLALTNDTDVGKSVGRPNTTFQGSSSSTLTFDLMMDTADQGDTDHPVDVQTLTAQLQYFLLPKTKEPKAVPPRVLFIFGTLQVAGVMSGLNLEYDLFSDGGVPLRAKASVTIKEQMPQFDAKLLGAGSNTGTAATAPVPAGAAAQNAGAASAGGPADSTGTALGGESAADFATRMGLDPSTWKSLAAGITDPLHLDAGLQIDFSSSASVSAGIGVDAGATSPAAGNDPGVTSAGGAMAPAASLSPAALTAAGGVSQAIAQQALSQSAAAAAATRAAFAPGPSAPAGPSAPTPGTAGAGASGTAGSGMTAGTSGTGAGGPVPQFPPDPRATSFGFGVPLRPLIAIPSRAAVATVHDVARGQAWPPAGTLGTSAGPATGTGPCGCGCGGLS
jgi:hypothetical protein